MHSKLHKGVSAKGLARHANGNGACFMGLREDTSTPGVIVHLDLKKLQQNNDNNNKNVK